MEISFKTKKLEKILNSEKKITIEYGSKRGRAIMRRMKVLKNANTLADVPHLPPERCHQLKENRDEEYAVVITNQWRIVFVPNHDPIPRKEGDNGIDLTKVTKIQITWIGDYHE